MQSKRSRILLAIFFIAAGLLHFIFPSSYKSIMPPWLPWHAELVYISGVAEVAGGIGVLIAQLRPYAGWGLIVLSLAVLPANVQMLLNYQAQQAPLWVVVLLALRLPLQVLLIWWIWHATRTRPKKRMWKKI